MNGPAIVVEGLTKRFRRRLAVDNVSFTVPAGSVCAFLGRNGAGKSTAIRIMMNLLDATAGQVTILGLDSRRDHTALMQRVGYVSDTPLPYSGMKVRELVRFTARFYPRWNHERVGGLLQRYQLDREQRVRNLSRGMQAQLALLLSLGHDPELLILDEPATGLDVVVRRDFLESIIQLMQQEGRTVLFSTHLLHEAERIADQVVVLDEGKLAMAGSVDEIKEASGRSLEDTFVEAVGGRNR